VPQVFTTTPPQPSTRWDRFERGLRFVAVSVVFAVVIGALAGAAGLSVATTEQTDGNLSVELTYASVTRPGIATPLTIDIRSVDGAALGNVEVTVPRKYLDLFDENGLAPEPTTIESDGTVETWMYEELTAPVLSIDYDARLQPNAHDSTTADVVVTSRGDRVRLRADTRVMP
jgi:hypothetical protein